MASVCSKLGPRRYSIIIFLLFFVSVYIFIQFQSYKLSLLDDYQQPVLYIITATYPRNVQRAELTKLCNTLRLVKNLLWIVVEDSNFKTKPVINLLGDCGVPYIHLNVETPVLEQPKPYEPYWLRPKGIHQRNLGLMWLRQHFLSIPQNGVVYIADDDNVYDVRIFEEMRRTKRVSTWPVAFAGELPWEGCVTFPNNRTQISDIWSAYNLKRPFPIDMAGFAVNLNLILQHTNAGFDYNRPRGMQESQYLLDLGLKHWNELEPLANGCQKILVWHIRTAEPVLAIWQRLESQGVMAPSIEDSP